MSGREPFAETAADAGGGLSPGAAPPAGRALPFDVCHAGVVLRALLFVHGVLAIGAVSVASTLSGWALTFAAAAAAALPGVLVWLLVACAARRWVDRRATPIQWAATLALGAACGGFGALLGGLAAGDDLARSAYGLGAALAGAAFAAALFAWLQARARALPSVAANARLAELQSRIRPHFLFNTLNTALALVRSDPARAEAVLEDLAELFRVAIAEAPGPTTLADELHLAERYLAIEQVRFGDRLRIVWEIDPAAGGARLPPLWLQPLVENAVRHGIEPDGRGGTIRVRTRARAGRAHVSIVNSLPTTASVPGSGIALRNVEERLQLMHDVAAQFEVRRDAESFRVAAVLPL